MEAREEGVEGGAEEREGLGVGEEGMEREQLGKLKGKGQSGNEEL